MQGSETKFTVRKVGPWACAVCFSLLIALLPRGHAADAPLGAAWWEGWSMDDPRLSQPIYEGTIEEPMSITLRDGVVLNGWVVRPLTPHGVTIPAILFLTPYMRDVPMTDPMLAEGEYVARGYAIVTVSIRGTGYSGGCVEFQGANEREDYAEVLDAIVSKDWSNGAVGAMGLSWVSTVANAALLSGHPALRTIVPIAAISDWYGFPFLNGVQYWTVGRTWNLEGSYVVMTNMAPGAPGYAPTLMERACEGYPEMQYEGAFSGVAGTRSQWWDERDFVRSLATPPQETGVLVVHGWRDFHVRTDHLSRWVPTLIEKGYETRAVIGQWSHNLPDRGTIPTGYPTDLRRRDSLLPIWNVTMLRWFDYWLKGFDTEILDMPQVLTQDESWAWHEEDGMVPTRAHTWRMYLDGDGELSGLPGSGIGVFVDTGLPPIGSGPRGVEAAYYQTPPLKDPLRYMGSSELHLRLSHTATTGQVGVTIYDVSDAGWYPIHFGYANYGLRNGPYGFDPVVPGEHFSIRVPVLPYDVVIPAGHRLGIAVGGQVELDPPNQPRYLPAPSGGATIIEHGEASYIELNVLDAIERVVFPGEPARP